MPLTQSVVDNLHLQPSLTNQFFHILRMVHLTVSIGHGCKIQTGHCQAKCCRVKALSVPKGLHYIQTAPRIHDRCRAAQDTHYLLFRKAVQKLAVLERDGVKLTQTIKGLAYPDEKVIIYDLLESVETVVKPRGRKKKG